MSCNVTHCSLRELEYPEGCGPPWQLMGYSVSVKTLHSESMWVFTQYISQLESDMDLMQI